MKIIVEKVRWNQNKFLTLHRKTAEICNYGVMLEWLKRHAWKACIPQKGIPSSNLGHSAKKPVPIWESAFSVFCNGYAKWIKNASLKKQFIECGVFL